MAWPSGHVSSSLIQGFLSVKVASKGYRNPNRVNLTGLFIPVVNCMLNAVHDGSTCLPAARTLMRRQRMCSSLAPALCLFCSSLPSVQNMGFGCGSRFGWFQTGLTVRFN